MTLDPLDNVAEEHIFHFRDGRQAHNLQDLKEAIEEMPLDEFNHHVDEFNNDFANWIEFVYQNSALANDLRKLTSRKEILNVLNVELGKYLDLRKGALDDEPVGDAVADGLKEDVDKGTNDTVKDDVRDDVKDAVKEEREDGAEKSTPNKKAVEEEEVAPATKKQFAGEPYVPTTPPQTIRTHTGEEVHTISTHAVHAFIVKEFIYGAIAGFIVGLLLMAILMNLGAFA